MAGEVEKPAPLPLSSMMDKDKEDSAAALEQEFTAKTPTGKGAAGSSMDDDDVDVDKLKLMKQSNKKVDDDGHRRSSLVARVDQKVRMLLMAVLLPPLIPVKEVCRWALSNSLHMACWSSFSARRIFERRLESLPPPEAAVARVLPTASLWCGAAGVAAAALALLLGAGGSRRGRLALAYVALAAATANHCLCARILVLVLVDDDTHVHVPLALCTAAIVVFFAARDLAGFRSLRKAAAAAEDDHVKKQ